MIRMSREENKVNFIQIPDEKINKILRTSEDSLIISIFIAFLAFIRRPAATDAFANSRPIENSFWSNSDISLRNP